MPGWRGKQKAIFFRGLSVLLNSGVHIIQALDSLADQSIDEPARRTVEGISARISSGFPLHKAMQAERVFSALEVGLVRVGERSGSLHSILQKLADATEAQDGLRRKLAAALVYPAFVLALATLLLIFAPVFVFSDLLDLLAELNTELPLATRIYLAFSALITSPFTYLVLLILGGLLTLLARKLLAEEDFRAKLESLIIELPGFGSAFTSCVSAEVSQALAAAYGAGIPLLDALKLSGEVSISVLFRRELKHSINLLQAGESLSNALAATGFYSPMALSILQSGEEVGLVSESLKSVAEESTKSTQQALDALQKLLEPCLLLFVGGIVGFISIATLAPTISMVEGL